MMLMQKIFVHMKKSKNNNAFTRKTNNFSFMVSEKMQMSVNSRYINCQAHPNKNRF